MAPCLLDLPPYETLDLEVHGRVLVVRLNRPLKHNAMTQTMFSELRQVLLQAGGYPAVGAIVLTGRGPSFSAGADLNTFQTLNDAAAYRAQLDLVEATFSAVEKCAVPVIAAVNGPALAGGLEILLFCDFVIASPDAVFGFSEVLVGLQPVYGLLRGPAVIGRNWTRCLAYTGENLDAQAAMSIGLVQRIVPLTSLVDEALRTAGVIASRAPEAIREGKRLANIHEMDLISAQRTAGRLFESETHKQAVEEFFRKRRRQGH